jgi:hypothetical protein
MADRLMQTAMAGMFRNAQGKLDDARNSLESLRVASDGPTFRSAFSGFLSSARAVTYALQKRAVT